MSELLDSGDCEVQEFVKVLKKLKAHLPISDQYDRDCGQENGVWWTNQKEHMIGWLSNQNSKGSGQFTRQKPNQSAKLAYQRLQCPGALLWMAEALGEDSAIVQKAADAARAESNKRRRSGIIRSHIPWQCIVSLISSHRVR
ncbi:MAG: hypothetical protein FWD27_05980 [Coriobacteriia bacterium]|nr:hypothetical protein [Coriobacteriia bacterium]